MRFDYDPETDSLYIKLVERPSTDSEEVSPGIVLDFDADGAVVGIDIEHASKVANFSQVVGQQTLNVPIFA